MHPKIFFLVTLAAVLPASARSHAAAQNPTFETRRLGFPELLGGSGELRLAAPSAARSVPFACGPDSVPLEGSELHLFLDHSPSLDSSRSFLSVTLNYGVLRSLRLDETNQRGAEIVIPLPPASLKTANELSLSVEQFGPEVWTSIAAQSYILLRYDPRPAAQDLASLPASLLGRGRNLDVILPESASTQSLEAASLLIATFAQRLAPDPLRVRAIPSMRAAANPVLIIGPENSDTAASLSSGMLVVGGLRAVQALIDPAAELKGTEARFSPAAPRAGMPPRAWPGFIPPEDRFTLGDGERPIEAARNFTVAVPLNATPDAVFLDRGHETTLSFRFDPAAFDANPELTVALNGAVLSRRQLRDLSKRPQFSLTLDIPANLLRTSNTLVISARGTPDSISSLGALLPDTQFYLPRDYRAVLPDLGLLRARFYPFTVRPDLSDTLLVIPDQPGPATIEALLQLSSGLGRMMPAEAAAFRVRRYSEATAKELAASHAILLGRTVPGARSLDDRGIPAVQEVVSPWNRRKCVLSITGGAPVTAVQRLFSGLPDLAGDAAYLGPAAPRCFAIAPRYAIEESSFLTHVQARLSSNWLALPLVLSLVSGILFLGTRLAIARRKIR